MDYCLFAFRSLLALLVVCLLAPASASTARDIRSISVKCVSIQSKVVCDYRHSPGFVIQELSAEISGRPVQVARESLIPFPALDQRSAILVLVDTSDPKRRFGVEARQLPLIRQLISAGKGHQSFALASFDTELRLIKSFSESKQELLTSISSIKVAGAATEFYRSTLAGVGLLKSAKADRKILVLFSDGKDEDRAYGLKDVKEAARDAGVTILAVGFAEVPSDTPYLQTLRRLSEETYGLFIDASGSAKMALGSAIQRLEAGGRFEIPGDGFYGTKEISVRFKTSTSQDVLVSDTVSLPDTRGFIRVVFDFLTQNVIYAGSAILLIALAFVFYRRYRLRAEKRLLLSRPFGYLEELDGAGTKHQLVGTAMRIGRGADNQIVLSNSSVSHHHAEIHRRREGAYFVVDLSSKNGVLVNGEAISQAELKSGDLLELGEVRLKVVF